MFELVLDTLLYIPKFLLINMTCHHTSTSQYNEKIKLLLFITDAHFTSKTMTFYNSSKVGKTARRKPLTSLVQSPDSFNFIHSIYSSAKKRYSTYAVKHSIIERFSEYDSKDIIIASYKNGQDKINFVIFILVHKAIFCIGFL